LEPAGATSVFLFALLTAVATGLGAVPFAFAKHPTRRWLGASNAIAAGLMLAASFALMMLARIRDSLWTMGPSTDCRPSIPRRCERR
jgi:zinc transporter ZupT